MQLFGDNTNIEGVDTINACYGGTNALFNALNWIESSSWDGRNAIVVAGDIAIYSRGAARPTGGAGAVAMLVGPDAPISLQTGARGTYMQHEYDFFKPDLKSEYPVVDGHYSLQCYTRSLDACYKAYRRREEVIARRSDHFLPNGATTNGHQTNGYHTNGDLTTSYHTNGVSNGISYDVLNGDSQVNGTNGHTATNSKTPPGEKLITDRFDYMCFHSPTSKLVSKSFARLAYNDYLTSPTDEAFKAIDPSIASISYQDSFTDRKLEKAFMALSADDFKRRVKPAMTCPSMCGNMYTASLYSSLVSLISNVKPGELLGKSIGMFSYGSGLASTLFSAEVVGDTSEMRQALDLGRRLEDRVVLDPEQFEEVSLMHVPPYLVGLVLTMIAQAMSLREQIHLRNDTKPVGSIDSLTKGTYYLTSIDGWRRSYQVA